MLHQRHMLVRRGMEHDIRAEAAEHLLQLFSVAHRGDLYIQIERDRTVEQLLLDVVGVVFIDIKDDDLLGVVMRHLPAQLGADGAAAARDEADLILDEGGHIGIVEHDRRPAQQIFKGDARRLLQERLVEHHFMDIGQCPDLAARLKAVGKDLLAAFDGAGGNGKQDGLDLVQPHQLADTVHRAADRNALDAAGDLVRVIVNDADGAVLAALRPQHFPDEHLAGLPAADDHGVFLRHMLVMRGKIVEIQIQQPRPDDGAGRDKKFHGAVKR